MFAALVAATILAQTDFPELKVYDHPFVIKSEYNKFKDGTTFKVIAGNVLAEDDLTVKLELVYFCQGQERKPIPPTGKVFFHLVSDSKEWEFLKVNDLALVVDGERMPLKGDDHNREVMTGYVLEFLWYDLPVRNLLKLAKAQTVEGQVGIKEFELTPKQITAIKDYAARLGVSGAEADKIEAKRVITQRERYNAIRAEFDAAVAAARREVSKMPKSLRAKRGNQVGIKVVAERIKPTVAKYGLTKAEIGEFLRGYPEFNPY
jgi:hypothetical protein